MNSVAATVLQLAAALLLSLHANSTTVTDAVRQEAIAIATQAITLAQEAVEQPSATVNPPTVTAMVNPPVVPPMDENTTPPSGGSPPTIPVQYQPLYNSLQSTFNAYNGEVNYDGSKYPVLYSTNLLSADDANGTNVFRNCRAPSVGSGCLVDRELDNLQNLGVTAVKVSVGYPDLDSNFYSDVGLPNSAPNFLTYYKALAVDVHSRGMKMIVQGRPMLTGVPGISSSSLCSFFENNITTWPQYVADRSLHYQTVAEQISPDFLDFQSEVTTEVLNLKSCHSTGINNNIVANLLIPQTDVAMIQTFVNDLQTASQNGLIPGLHTAIKLGSGTGAWTDGFSSYVSGLANITNLDDIDTHVYWLGNPQQDDEVANTISMAIQAHAAGKTASISEFEPKKTPYTWDQMNGTLLPPDDNVDINARDQFGFWDPLDEQIYLTMIQLANKYQLAFFSPYDDGLYWSYLDYNNQMPLPLGPPPLCPPVYVAGVDNGPVNAQCDANIQNAQNTLANTVLANYGPYSPLGLAFKADIAFYSSTSSAPSITVFSASPATITSGQSSTLSWVVSGSPAPSLSISPGIGTVTGSFILVSPAQTTTYTLTATNSKGSVATSTTVTVSQQQTLKITTASSLPDGGLYIPYTASLQASGGKTPYAWSIVSGNLPAGLTLNGSTGVISGTPTNTGSFNVLLKVIDSSSPQQSATASFSINNGVPAAPSNLAATVNSTGQVVLTWTNNATNAFGFGIMSATDNSFVTNNNVYTYTATTTYTDTTVKPNTTYYYKVDAWNYDPNGYSVYSNVISINTSGTGGGNPVTITTTSLPAGTVGSSYSQQLTASGGATPYAWSISSGNLPNGLALNSGSGVISGTPTNAGNFSFTVKVVDSSSPQESATQALTLLVSPSPLKITTTSLPAGTVGTSYSAQLSASGGTQPYAWSVSSGNLPGGLVLNNNTGAISGTPTGAGSFNFTVKVTDSSSPQQSATQALTILISSPPLMITTTSLPAGTVGTSYTAQLSATGGTSPYAWSITSGNLPGGLVLTNGTGAISGTPTTAGTFNFTVKVVDNSSPQQSATVNLSITISTPSNGAPAAPSNLVASLNSSGQVVLTWTDNSNNESGFGIIRSTDNFYTYTATYIGANLTTYTDTATAGKTLYYYRVQAYNGSGWSTNSNTVTITTP